MKKNIAKIIFCTGLAAILQILSANIKNQSAAHFLTVVEIVLMLFVLRVFFSLTKKRIVFLAKKAKELLKKALAPIIAKIRGRHGRRKFVRGSDEKRLVFNFGIMDKLKDRLKPRKKTSLKNISSNAEKIRLLYIRLILTLIDRHYRVKHSHTPKELKTDLAQMDRNESDILFDTYENVRYGNLGDDSIPDGTVALCENIFEKRST